ncbi:HPr family phosphocarrier protein [Alkaliphilus peptidifermentans]|uniref:Phosphocarrier protein HPr n=1 Tax=Alkaliphilus peptidifermentans DSM 18978 TaxID=1120976 RepID=A0A1G5FVZ3_9FIRM|nr:HPr family phosphocarrier protein [Alkaliphilus peptidifermentans]SCY43307.1 phosphocarrier protein [Alkaliphilus peptidifermentans DSM 18978]
MIKREVVVYNKVGIHARPASQLVKLATKFKSDIQIEHKERLINAKSLMMLLSAGIRYEDKLMVIADGDDAKEAIDELVHFIETNEN